MRIPTAYANEFRWHFLMGEIAGYRGDDPDEAEYQLPYFGFHAPVLWCLRAFYAGYENGAKRYARSD